MLQNTFHYRTVHIKFSLLLTSFYRSHYKKQSTGFHHSQTDSTFVSLWLLMDECSRETAFILKIHLQNPEVKHNIVYINPSTFFTLWWNSGLEVYFCMISLWVHKFGNFLLAESTQHHKHNATADNQWPLCWASRWVVDWLVGFILLFGYTEDKVPCIHFKQNLNQNQTKGMIIYLATTVWQYYVANQLHLNHTGKNPVFIKSHVLQLTK
jgi:hypothetical protein